MFLSLSKKTVVIFYHLPLLFSNLFWVIDLYADFSFHIIILYIFLSSLKNNVWFNAFVNFKLIIMGLNQTVGLLCPFFSSRLLKPICPLHSWHSGNSCWSCNWQLRLLVWPLRLFEQNSFDHEEKNNTVSFFLRDNSFPLSLNRATFSFSHIYR